MNRKDYKKLPEVPGVYLMKDASGKILYVGKAGNLRRRVSSYFERPHDVRIETLVSRIVTIDFEETGSALEALMREAELIKTLTPPFNVREKDDKSFLYIEITKEKFPRVMLVRGTFSRLSSSLARSTRFTRSTRFGPFVSASSAREAMKILRRIFPWNTHPPELIGKYKRPCFDYEIGLCPGTCLSAEALAKAGIGVVTQIEYRKNIARLTLFLEGKKQRVMRALEKEMAAASKKNDFEKAIKLRRQLFALRHIQDTALIHDSEVSNLDSGITNHFRIEGYDISNISGTSAVGSMVVFENGEPNKNEYRKFKIKTVEGPNDVGMLTEVLERRFARSFPPSSTSHQPPATSSPAWPLPNLILIDGGLAQVNAAYRVMRQHGLKIPMVGMVKGVDRKRTDIIGAIPKGILKETLIKVRDEAHRFAITYHKALRRKQTFQ